MRLGTAERNSSQDAEDEWGATQEREEVENGRSRPPLERRAYKHTEKEAGGQSHRGKRTEQVLQNNRYRNALEVIKKGA